VIFVFHLLGKPGPAALRASNLRPQKAGFAPVE
jgi:hypothetical protein